MRRAPIVVASTAAGLGLVLTFHTHAPSLAKVATATPPGSGNSGQTGSAPGGSPASTTAPTTGPTTGPTTSPPTAATTRSATSPLIQYIYGDMELKVTERGSKIIDVAVVRNDTPDMQSQFIDQQVDPMLRTQAMSVQSAKINGVSGATFTSAAYAQALQAALDKLKA